MDNQNYLSEKIKNYYVRVYNNSLVENIDIYDTNDNQIKTLEIENLTLDLTTSKFAYNYSKIILYLKNGILLITQNSFHERTSRDGVDLSTDYFFTRLVNLHNGKNNYASLKKDRFGNTENEVGKYFGLFSFKISKIHQIGFNIFENYIISNCILNKYIIETDKFNIPNFFEMIGITNNLSLKEKYLLNRGAKIFKIYDLDFNEIINNVSLFEIIEFLSSYDFNIKEYLSVIKTIENSHLKNKNEIL